jgi:hypothetical protein
VDKKRSEGKAMEMRVQMEKKDLDNINRLN